MLNIVKTEKLLFTINQSAIYSQHKYGHLKIEKGRA